MNRQPLTTRDLIVIAQWARTTWYVAHSLRQGSVQRPEYSGGTLSTDLHPDTTTEFPPDADWLARTGPGIEIHTIEWTESPAAVATDTIPHYVHRTLHRVTWPTVQHWLDAWTRTDRRHLIALNQEHFGIQHTPEELEYHPGRSTADTLALADRRDQRMQTWGYARCHELDTEMTNLVRRYISGDRSAAQATLF